MFLVKYFEEKKIKKQTEAFNKAGVLRCFSYVHGNMAEGMTSYLLNEENEQLHFVFLKTSMENGEQIRSDMYLPLNEAQSFKKIIRDEQIFIWNGYNKSSSIIATGNSFEIKAVFDNYNLKAAGVVMMPAGYEDKHKALIAFLNSIVQKYYTEISEL